MARVEYALVTNNADKIVLWVGKSLPDAGVQPPGPIRLHLGADDEEWQPEVADLDIEDAQALVDLLGQAISTARRQPGAPRAFPFGAA